MYVGKTKAHARQVCEAEARVVLSTFPMAAEALDIARLSCLVLATPASRGTLLQSVGRVQRTHPDKPTVAIVDDIVDTYSVFQSMWFARRSLYTKQGFALA
jgi:superfamily II DNA or RNA helicase